jgi:two-component system CitB family sensor kinase
MFEYYQAILYSVREGLVLLDREGRVVLCNDAARELLGLRTNPQGLPADALGLAPVLTAALVSPEPCLKDEIYVGDTRVLVINTAPVRSRDHVMGNVVTLRDHTELQALTGELDTVRGFADSLHAQAHEAANRLHTVVSLVELDQPERAVQFATAELKTAQQLTDRLVGAVTEPVLAALLLGKSTEASERGVELVITEDTRRLPVDPPQGVSPETLREITDALIAAPDGLSAAQAATATGVTRVTARKYLEYLANTALAQRKQHYGGVGRPEVRFYPQ